MGQTKTRRFAACAATGLALVVAGCGSSSSGNSDASFLAAVNSLCKMTNAQGNALPQLSSSSSQSEVVSYFQKAQTIAQQAQAKLKTIKAPGDKQATFSQFESNIDMTLPLIQQVVSAAQAGDLAKLRQAGGQIQTLNSQNDQLAAKLGATDCVTKNSSGTSSGTTS